MSLFQEIRIFLDGDFCNNVDLLGTVEKIFENYNLTKLDIKRIYRYLDKIVKRDLVVADDDELDEEM